MSSLCQLNGPRRFEWHAPKAAATRAKNNVVFEEAATVSNDPLWHITAHRW
jgi:uncharacterized DUF497 family protein